MFTATGNLRYEPPNPSGSPAPGWAMLACDPDWHRMYQPDAEQAFPGGWKFVVDADRIFLDNYDGRPPLPLVRRYIAAGGVYTEHQMTVPFQRPQFSGGFTDYTPHLAFMRQPYARPAWGPHISVLRGEQPRDHIGIWQQQARIGALAWRVLVLTNRMANTRDKARALMERLATTTYPKEHAKRQREVESYNREIRIDGLDLARVQQDLDRLRARQTSVEWWLREGAAIPFEYRPRLRLGGTHWFLDVRSPQAVAIRKFYGLADSPRVPLHLTVGVTDL